ncbi:hypothetical protein GCM10009530_78370 [Microbispora corallina]|uniref:Uncharacterized protein n=1 Tax=Microbispora corallina TaxID=83302 RepID=A0ABQ4GCT1_9ACTN|nr:hypothetical protein Mco01_77930 [Microbispora corallina]
MQQTQSSHADVRQGHEIAGRDAPDDPLPPVHSYAELVQHDPAGHGTETTERTVPGVRHIRRASGMSERSLLIVFPQ